MAAKGVCTSPNGVIGCKSATCPGSSFTANLESLKFYEGELHETRKYGSRDEWDSLEMNLNITVDSLLDDYLALDDESRSQIREALTDEDKKTMEEFNSDFDSKTIFTATENFKRSTIDEIVQGYFEAAVWTDLQESQAEVDPEAFEYFQKYDQSSSVKDVYNFLASHTDEVKKALQVYPAANFGHDFWLTRNGHGTGFWDREELKEIGVADALSDVARKEFPERSFIVSDAGFYHAE
jgi:hypothetical protein